MKTTMSQGETVSHTPGPWTFADDSDGRILVTSPWSDKTKPGEASGYGDFRGLHICSLDHQGTNPCVSKVQAEANAKLIAASPDLLEACEAALALLVDDGNQGGTEWTIKTLRNAISQATPQKEGAK